MGDLSCVKGLLERGYGRRKRDYVIFRPRLLSFGNQTLNNLPPLNKVSLDSPKRSQVSPVDKEAADASQGLNTGVNSALAHLASTQAHKARDRRKQYIDFPNCYENVSGQPGNHSELQRYKLLQNKFCFFFIECKTDVWICFQCRKENNNIILS